MDGVVRTFLTVLRVRGGSPDGTPVTALAYTELVFERARRDVDAASILRDVSPTRTEVVPTIPPSASGCSKTWVTRTPSPTEPTWRSAYIPPDRTLGINEFDNSGVGGRPPLVTDTNSDA